MTKGGSRFVAGTVRGEVGGEYRRAVADVPRSGGPGTSCPDQAAPVGNNRSGQAVPRSVQPRDRSGHLAGGVAAGADESWCSQRRGRRCHLLACGAAGRRGAFPSGASRPAQGRHLPARARAGTRDPKEGRQGPPARDRYRCRPGGADGAQARAGAHLRTRPVPVELRLPARTTSAGRGSRDCGSPCTCVGQLRPGRSME